MDMKKLMGQWSTWRGLAVMAASACGVAPGIIAAGGSLLGALPGVVTAAAGLYDTVRDETKEGKKAKEQGATKGK